MTTTNIYHFTIFILKKPGQSATKSPRDIYPTQLSLGRSL